jgi:hypothetical protein
MHLETSLRISRGLKVKHADHYGHGARTLIDPLLIRIFGGTSLVLQRWLLLVNCESIQGQPLPSRR